MIYAAEYVLPGHPDKLCDAIADALVEEAARREKRALCGIEVAVHRAEADDGPARLERQRRGQTNPGQGYRARVLSVRWLRYGVASLP